MKKIVLFVFISIILICIGCDLSFLQKKDTLQTTSSQTEQTPDNAQQDTSQPEQGTNKPQPGQNPGNPEKGEDTDNSQSSTSQPGQDPDNSQSGEDTDNSQSGTSQPGQDTDNSQSGTSQPGQDPDNPETGEETDNSQSGTSQPGQNPDNPEKGEDTDDSQSGTSQPGQDPDNPETGEDVDNPQQDQNETTVKSQNTIDFFYTINGRDITLTPVVSWEGVDETTLEYLWYTSDLWGAPQKNLETSIPELATSTAVKLEVYNGKASPETLLGEVSKTISITDSFPTDSTTDTGPKQLFLFAEDENHPDKNLDYMYFALQIKGTSSHGTFRTEATKDGQDTYAYPRSVQYEHESSAEDRYTSMYAQATPNLANLGVGYTEATGFSPTADGTSFSMPFYLGDNKCRVKMNGTSTLRYSFANFVVWDTTVDTFLGNWGWPVLIRLPSSEPLIITIPMDQYDSSQHKNIALLTVTLNDNASKTDFKYDVQFDRFVNKNE